MTKIDTNTSTNVLLGRKGNDCDLFAISYLY